MNTTEEEFCKKHHHHSREYCDSKLKEIEDKIDVLKAEYKINHLYIKEKVTGLIRKSQGRNKEIRDEIWGLNVSKWHWYNGGVS